MIINDDNNNNNKNIFNPFHLPSPRLCADAESPTALSGSSRSSELQRPKDQGFGAIPLVRFTTYWCSAQLVEDANYAF